MRGDTFAWDRRQVLKLAGGSAAGVAATSQLGTVGAQSSDASITIDDQETDGDTIVVAAAETDVESQLIIISDHQVDGVNINYRTIELEPGASYTDRTIELTEPIPESQRIRAEIRTPERDSELLARDGATVAVGESLDEMRPTIELIEENPDDGFHFPYLLYTPDVSTSSDSVETAVGDTNTRPLLVGFSPRAGSTSDHEERLESGQNDIERGRQRFIADEMDVPSLVALLPGRADDGSFRNLDHNSLQVTSGPNERLDLQLLAMVDDARDRLVDEPYEVAEKFHLDGYSSRGRFAGQMTMLHPDRVNAISGGGNGTVRIPKSELDEDIPTIGNPETNRLPWGVGVADLNELTGTEFDRESWLTVDQFRYIGAEDQGDPDEMDHPSEYRHSPSYRHFGEERQQLLLDIFGWRQVDERFETSRAIYENVGTPAEFVAYEGVGHEVTGEMREDIAEFHRQKMYAEYGPSFVFAVEWPTETVETGVEIPVSVDMANPTDSSSTVTLALSVVNGDAEPVETMEASVAAGDTDAIEFDYTFEESGEYAVSVDGTHAENSLTVVEANDQPSDETEQSDDSDSEQDEPTVEDQPGFGVVQTIAALGGIGYLIKRRISGNE